MIQIFNLRTISAVLLLFLVSIHVANAQKNEAPEVNIFNTYSYLTTNILSSINGTSPRLRAGYIQNINRRLKIGLDVGFGNRNTTFYKDYDNYQLWEIRPEFYYFLNTKRKTRKYISLEPFYINHKNTFLIVTISRLTRSQQDMTRSIIKGRNMECTLSSAFSSIPEIE